jgi:nicotinamidase-related amidase
MECSTKTARQLYEEIREKPKTPRFGFGRKPMLVNIDLQRQYTDSAEFHTAYGTAAQLDHVNELVRLFRASKLPIVWTYVAYMESGEDCGVWGTRVDTPDALQNIKIGSHRAELDGRLEVDHAKDVVMKKLMPSAFHETNLRSLMVWHGCDTIIVTGGSTSGCVRATVVDGLSSGYRMIVPEECVADRHESPHFANLYDMAVKYADVLPVSDVIAYLATRSQA